MRERYLRLILLACIACFLFMVIPAAATKTAEASVSDTLTRGSRFTVTITGLPSSAYYIWLQGTSTMSGEPRDQPPVISDNMANVDKDSPDGPYSIGSYQFNNGDGRIIRDDIAASSSVMSNTNYYALATTDTTGRATVEFQTSLDTALRSYSVRVENPRSIDSDNLQVRLQVFSRKAPVVITAITTAEPFITQTAETSRAPGSFRETALPTILPTTTVMHVQTPTPSLKASLAPCISFLGAACVLVIKRR